MGVQNSEIRAQLIDAAEQIIREEGSGALTARRLAEKVDLKRQIVHYYFGTIDDVLLAVMRRSADKTRERLQRALMSDEPLKVMWQEGHVTTTTSLELLAMAVRHEGARLEIKHNIEEFRGLLTQALTRELERRGLKSAIPPEVVTIVMMAISEALAVEATLGVSMGHAATRTLLRGWFREYIERGDVLGRRSTPKPAAARRRKPGIAKKSARKKRSATSR
jgi:AcrR family transcriptional regulator